MVIDTPPIVKTVNHFTPPESLSNPWMEIDQPSTKANIVSNNVSPTQPDSHPTINDTFHVQNSLTPSTTVISPLDELKTDDKHANLGSVDDSIHTPSRNKNKRTQTYDARILVSDVPGTLPSEKINWLKSWFLGYKSLRHIYVDEIFN